MSSSITINLIDILSMQINTWTIPLVKFQWFLCMLMKTARQHKVILDMGKNYAFKICKIQWNLRMVIYSQDINHYSLIQMIYFDRHLYILYISQYTNHLYKCLISSPSSPENSLKCFWNRSLSNPLLYVSLTTFYFKIR